MFERLVDFWRVLAPKWKVLLGVGVALVVVLVVFGTRIVYRFILKDVPPPLPAYETVELNNNVWTAEERQWYYHTSQGSQIMPYDWFVALEQGDNDRPFIAEENLSRFRVIPDTNTLGNPDRLPVGFAKDDPDPVTKTVNVGFSCATCHTAQVTYKGKSFIVDGAPGRLNFDDFVGALVGSLLVTVGPPVLNPKWDRFARKVLKENYSLDNSARLRIEVAKFTEGQLAGVEKQKQADRRSGLSPTPGGFG
ncbi:MAG TPA: di-heme-cytochrome C peroxidase, partial [Pyrinomonadaceae bacterium]|nr:di-heme-cytochrome C peroxidase [Pyrinomonadaceae bacterium]